MRTEDEIWEQIDAAQAHVDQGKVAWPGMSYEQGVAEGLRWALGDSDEAPMQDDD